MLEQIVNQIVQVYGPWGLFVAMIIQTIVAPISSEAVIMFSGALGIDIWKIVIFGGLGTIIGAILAFFIARKGGRPIVMKILGDEWIENLDAWVNQKGRTGILVTRLVPIIPFDLISYISGITSLKFIDYFIPTVLGVFPRMLILAFLGNRVGHIFRIIGFGMDLLIALGFVGFIVIIWLDRKGKIKWFKRFVFKRILKVK
ncbi:MAG: VTT domain-containing protein [Candidatus Aenigmatarchaeota archaeon]